ncbi:TIGR03862 family flavoprotein [Oxalobacteraceae bacterium CAVE-383]|nr:TIGR03862 family flavoprotein [Oxalobacteraceae bacterium CAVE-383]
MSGAAGAMRSVAVIGGGPAGLMAAEVLAQGGMQVDLYDAMPSVGRKFLLAGKGGMNITHAEAMPAFVTRYRGRQKQIAPLLAGFTPDILRTWIAGLGIDTFVGSSNRVFPTDMKAAPLLRNWLHRLRESGVRFHMRHRWTGWDEQKGGNMLRFATPAGQTSVQHDAVVLALGGGSWPRLGSDGAWTGLLQQRGVDIAPLQPANCGFEVPWSEYFRARCTGQAVKSIAVTCTDPHGAVIHKQGEFVVSDYGVEGSLIYALSAPLRDAIAESGSARIMLDLMPDWSVQRVLAEVARPRGARSLSSHLQSRLSLTGVKAGLLRELAMPAEFKEASRLAERIKALPLTLTAPRPLEEAISSAGGVRFEALDAGLMLHALPGVFCAGEMLDWEAPTGGYLLTACFAAGRAAGLGALEWLSKTPQPPQETSQGTSP